MLTSVSAKILTSGPLLLLTLITEDECMHVPYSQVSDSIPEIVWEAFEEADHIYTEVDLTSPKAVVDEVKKASCSPVIKN